jgi:photosystem II stability/assembly factor-like uncharacterized protein
MREPAERVRDTPAAPLGGKSLLRLFEHLETRGLHELAVAAVATAIPPQAVPEFVAVAAQLAPDPTGEPRALQSAVAAPPEQMVDLTAEASEAVARTYLAAAEELRAADVAAEAWVSLGPTTIPNGQTYGANRVNVSGRVSALAIDPGDAQHILAGAANGGVWETSDGGNTWAPRTDTAATLAVGAMAYDPQSPATVYCGTGEGNWWAWLGVGILRSRDGGTTWATLCRDPFVGDGFFDLSVDPADGEHLVAGTHGGLWTSADGGATWARARPGSTWSVAIDPRGGAGGMLAGCSAGVVQSTDGGATWATAALPGAPATWTRIHVAIAGSNPDTAYAWGSDGATAYLWRRTGGVWSAVATPPGVSVAQAWYDWFLAVAPDLDSQVFVGAIDAYRGDLSGAAPVWVNITSKTADSSIHPDQHAIAFAPDDPSGIYIGNDGGVYKSPDRGDTWQHCNNGLVITEFEYLAQDLTSAQWLIGGTQDNGTQRWTGDPIWTHIADGDGGHCGVNSGNPATVFHTYYGMNAERSTAHGDWGTWVGVSPQLGPGEGSLFYPPLACGVAAGDTLAMGGDALYVSRDNGTTWNRLAYPRVTRASALHVSTPDAVYVGTTDGGVFSTIWNGAAWSAPAALGTPRQGAFITDLYVDPAQARLWATFATVGGGRVFRSDDGGNTWVDCSANLPALPINAVAVNTADPNMVWVAADLGVYQSTDAGGSWQPYSTGLPNAYVGDLAYHGPQRRLRAGTRNRGVWEREVNASFVPVYEQGDPGSGTLR